MAKVMMVDDDPDFLDIQRGVLESRGHEVITVEKASEAVETARREKPDVVVVDLMMEEEDAGFELCYRFKKGEAGFVPPVVMVTGVASDPGIPFDGEADGGWIKADAFLNKPIRPEELISTVERLAGGE